MGLLDFVRQFGEERSQRWLEEGDRVHWVPNGRGPADEAGTWQKDSDEEGQH